MTESNETLVGRVAWFDPQKGYGFITPTDGSKDIFVHFTNIECDGFKTLGAGQLVSYKVGTNHKGSQAVDVQEIKSEEEKDGKNEQDEKE